MKLQKLKQELDKKYGFDIGSKKRSRQISYARKVFCSIAKKLPHRYTMKEIGDSINISHEVVTYHSSSINVVSDSDLEIHDSIINENGLYIKTMYSVPDEFIESKKLSEARETLMSSIEEQFENQFSEDVKQLVLKANSIMFNWTSESLNNFIENRLIPYDNANKSRIVPKSIKQVKGAKIKRRVFNPVL